MSTIREVLSNRGNFVKLLAKAYDDGSIPSLIEAYGAADIENQSAIESALWDAGVMKPGADELNVRSVFEVMQRMYWRTREIKQALATRFSVLRRIDEEVENPYEIPIR